MTTREMVEAGGCSFDGVLNFDGVRIVERVVAVMEREDGPAEKILSYGLLAFTGLYLFGSIIRALV